MKKTRQHSPAYTPKPNDLILFTNKASAILSDYNQNNTNYSWSQSIVSIEPNQTALIIDSYTVNNNSNKAFTNPTISNTLSVAIELSRHHKPHMPSPPLILICVLSNLIIETMYDPDVIHSFPHPDNLLPPIHPPIEMILAR